MTGPRDFLGYGGRPPDPRWPDQARLALSIVLNVEEGAELSLTMRMREVAPPKSGMPRREYAPPTAVRMGLDKIWSEFERELRSGRSL